MRIRPAAIVLAAAIVTALPFALGAGGERSLTELVELGFQVVKRLSGRTPAHGVEVSSDQVRVVDGDTLALGEERIRLFGVDAPELRQTCQTRQGRDVPCGEMARQQLERLVRGSPSLGCDMVDRDRYGRAVGRCTRNDGVEVNRAMVRQGWALPYVEYGGDAYARDHERARADGLGLHELQYQEPEEYRRRQRGGG